MADPKKEAEEKAMKEKFEKLKADKNFPLFKELFQVCLAEEIESRKTADDDFFLLKFGK